MGIFTDSWGLRPWVVLVGIVTVIATLIWLLISVMAQVTFSDDKKACTRVSEVTQRQTQMVGNRWSHECYIRVNDQWIPLSNWRVN